MDIEALRLARAKAMRPVMKENATCLSAPCLYGDCLCADELARAIESADAALGVVSVPEYPTQEIADAFFSGQTKRDTDIELPAWIGDFGNFAASWSDAVAASPLREKSDEQ